MIFGCAWYDDTVHVSVFIIPTIKYEEEDVDIENKSLLSEIAPPVKYCIKVKVNDEKEISLASFKLPFDGSKSNITTVVASCPIAKNLERSFFTYELVLLPVLKS